MYAWLMYARFYLLSSHNNSPVYTSELIPLKKMARGKQEEMVRERVRDRNRPQEWPMGSLKQSRNTV